MRFIETDPPVIPNGAKELRTWFAWLPITIGKETRWLEKVTAEFEYWDGGMSWYSPCLSPRWEVKRFVN